MPERIDFSLLLFFSLPRFFRRSSRNRRWNRNTEVRSRGQKLLHYFLPWSHRGAIFHENDDDKSRRASIARHRSPRFIDRSCNRLVEFAGWNFGYAIEDVVFGGSLIRVNGPGQEDRAETRPLPPSFLCLYRVRSRCNLSRILGRAARRKDSVESATTAGKEGGGAGKVRRD